MSIYPELSFGLNGFIQGVPTNPQQSLIKLLVIVVLMVGQPIKEWSVGFMISVKTTGICG